MIYYSELKYNRRFGEINISRPENGYGVYFYPPIEYEEKEAIYKFKKFKIYINKEGYLATSTKDKKISEECFNSIFLSTSLLVYPVLKVNEGEFEKLRKTGSGSYLTPRTLLGAPKIGGQIRKGLFNKKIIISKNEFKIIRHLAELVYNSKFKFGIFAFYDGYTRFYFEDYTGSFILNWMAIEYYISKSLEEYLTKKKVFKELIDKINQEWNVHKKMAYLQKKKIIGKKDYKVYEKRRKIRNRIVHSEYKPSRKESEECKDVANSVIKKLFNKEGIDINLYLNDIKKLKYISQEQ